MREMELCVGGKISSLSTYFWGNFLSFAFIYWGERTLPFYSAMPYIPTEEQLILTAIFSISLFFFHFLSTDFPSWSRNLKMATLRSYQHWIITNTWLKWCLYSRKWFMNILIVLRSEVNTYWSQISLQDKQLMHPLNRKLSRLLYDVTPVCLHSPLSRMSSASRHRSESTPSLPSPPLSPCGSPITRQTRQVEQQAARHYSDATLIISLHLL